MSGSNPTVVHKIFFPSKIHLRLYLISCITATCKQTDAETSEPYELRHSNCDLKLHTSLPFVSFEHKGTGISNKEQVCTEDVLKNRANQNPTTRSILGSNFRGQNSLVKRSSRRENKGMHCKYRTGMVQEDIPCGRMSVMDLFVIVGIPMGL